MLDDDAPVDAPEVPVLDDATDEELEVPVLDDATDEDEVPEAAALDDPALEALAPVDAPEVPVLDAPVDEALAPAALDAALDDAEVAVPEVPVGCALPHAIIASEARPTVKNTP